MTLVPSRLAPSAALLSLALAGPALAQADNRTLVRAGADGRFEMLIDAPAALRGHAPAKVAAFRDRIDALVALFRAMPAVHAPAFPGCTRLDSWIERNDIRPVLMGSVGVQTPEAAGAGRCARRSEMSVRVAINQLGGFLPPAHATPGGGAHDWYVLPVRRRGPGMIELDSGAILHFEARAAPLRPVSTEAYARHQLAQLTNNGAHDGGELGALYRRRIESWTPAERAMPACAPDPSVMPDDLEDMLVAAVPDCPPQRIVVTIDDAYLDVARPATIQMLALSNPPRATLESDTSWTVRTRIWAAIDHKALRALLAE